GLKGEGPGVITLAFPASSGRWEVRRGAFRQGGRPHQFVVLADVSRALREEERRAWQRLIRVLGHEINNSLTPIKSVAQQLQQLVSGNGSSELSREDLDTGLELIAKRSESLTRFLSSYARLARLPPPKIGKVDVPAWVQRVARLETRVPVAVTPGPPPTLPPDRAQLDQLLVHPVT